ncbi:MAG TPA: type II toxin-antitoxin system HicB family antitoxin [Chryseosolibacter sp.]
MKIDSVVIKDKKTGTFFMYVRQFPGICAQGENIQEAQNKVNSYFKAYVERIKDEEVQTDDAAIVTM